MKEPLKNALVRSLPILFGVFFPFCLSLSKKTNFTFQRFLPKFIFAHSTFAYYFHTERSKVKILLDSNGRFLYQCQRTLNVGGSITACLVSSFTSLDSTAASLHTNNNIGSFWAKSNLLKLETSLYSDQCPYGECSLFLVSVLNKEPRFP